MNGVLLAPFAKLFELNLSFNELLILGRPIINPFAVRAGEFYQSIL